ncbi:30S ribosomal protein S6e [Thermococci archaeon]|nr:MAG: 30S ribosomal protein S6e [Thermococci archaeon]RLF97423.1 MAG: 30S ribosomal protein S6e [Thermococci archaeon]
MEIKLVISDPSSGKAHQFELKDEKARIFLGKKIGDTVDLTPIGFPGYKVKITGGSDKDGFPMRKDVQGTGRRRILLSSGPGYRPREKGIRKRKTVRGNTISEEIVQVNVKVIESGEKSLEELRGG